MSVGAVLLLCLAACQPPAEEKAEPATNQKPSQDALAPAPGCSVSVKTPWMTGKTPADQVDAEALVVGPACEQGAVLLVIRQGDGAPLYTWAGETQFIFGLSEAKDPAAMKDALTGWLDQGPDPRTTAGLPDWEETDGQPKRAEFPFIPADGTDKTAWTDLKKENLSMFCFAQGMESQACLAFREGGDGEEDEVEDIGLQLFPG